MNLGTRLAFSGHVKERLHQDLSLQASRNTWNTSMASSCKSLCVSAPFAAALLLLQLISTPALAQPKPPTLERFFPAGAQRGATLEVKAEGSFERWPVEAWVDQPGLEVAATEEKGKLEIKVDAEATPGPYLIRLYDSGGATSLRPFVVGTLPEVVEVEPNNDLNSPQTLESARVVVNGRLEKNGDVDGYSVTLKAGETLVAAILAHDGLGSPMDAVLQVVTPDGFVLAQEDDSPGLDPHLIFEAPADGDYIVRTFAFPETPTSTIGFSGGDAFVYRLTLTTGGYADYAHPSVISKEETAEVELSGWNLPEDARRITLPPEGEKAEISAFHPEVANSVPLRRVEHTALAEEAVSGPIRRPVTISGRIDSPSQVDSFTFEANQGESIVFRADARSLGSPLDPVLRVADATDKTLAEQDDNSKHPDPTLTFKARADGTYTVSIRDLHGRGGPRFFYHLTVKEPTPSFALSTTADHFELLPGGKPLEIEVAVNRLDGFSDSIEILVEGLPEGVSVKSATSEPKGDSSKQVKLSLESEGELEPFAGPIQIVGRSGEVEQIVSDVWFSVVKPIEEEAEEEDSEDL